MKRIYLQKIVQHGTECYIGKIDPRKLVRVAAEVGMSTTQDAQRPLNEKRVKDIAAYVDNEKGILPNTITLATNDSSFDIHSVEGEDDLFFINFPETDDEFKNYKEKIDVMDGQHRLYSFKDDICILQDDEIFEIGFTLYVTPTLMERRKIFISCNEKQEKVSPNLLLWFKEKLNMIQTEDKLLYDIVQSLSQEHPLKGHIIMSAEKIKNGVKAKEVMNAIKQSKIQDMTAMGTPLSNDQKVKVICLYLSAWETVAGFSFASSSRKDAGSAITMAGLKYMLLLLPTIWERSINLQKQFDKKFVEETLKQFIALLAIEKDSFFTGEENKMCFRDRTAVDLFASESIKKIKSLGNETFNPLSFLG